MAILSHEKTQQLIREAQAGDEGALAILVERNLPLVASIARRFFGRGAEHEDVMQTGAMGLVKAIQNFDLSRGLRFSTYAVPVIMGEIQIMLRGGGPVHVSRTIKAQARALMEAEQNLRTQGMNPGIAEIAEAVGMSVAEAAFALDSQVSPRSIYEPCARGSEDATLLGDTLSAPEQPVEQEDKLVLKQLLEDLPPQERKVILLRYFREWPQARVAEALEVSQAQVSRMEKRILEKLRNAIGDGVPPPWERMD